MSAEPREVRDARRKATEAADLARSIEALPRHAGQSVRWPHNGVVWTRAGDDDWRPDSDPERRYPSAHIASIWWEPIDAQDGAR